jgi:hypothetical protein
MKKKLILAIIPLILMGLIAFMAGCSTSDSDSSSGQPNPLPTGAGSITGRVMDESGRPIVGAQAQAYTQDRSDRGQASSTTDEKGIFTFIQIAPGVYTVSISYEGRVSIQTVIVLTEGNPESVFDIFLPLGTGSASFDMPVPPVLGQPSGIGQAVDLTWAREGSRDLSFDAYNLFRSDVSGVSTDDGLIFESSSPFASSYHDTLPEPGRFHYRLFAGYTLASPAVRVLVGSNEVSGYWDKYVFFCSVDVAGETEEPPYLGGIALDQSAAETYVYVTDMYFNRVLKYQCGVHDPVAIWKTFTTPEGEDGFIAPVAVTTDKLGNVYVLDNGGNKDIYPGYRIVKLNSQGAYVTQWFISGYAFGLAVGGQDQQYVFTVEENQDGYTVAKYSTDGEELGRTNPFDYDMWVFFSIAADASNNVYVGAYTFTVESIMFSLQPKIVKFNGSTMQHVKTWDHQSWAPVIPFYYYSLGMERASIDEIFLIFGLSVAPDGNLFATRLGAQNILLLENSQARATVEDGFVEYTPDGAVVVTYGSTGSGDGQFVGAQGIAIDTLKNAYVADTGNARLQKIDLDLEMNE